MNLTDSQLDAILNDFDSRCEPFDERLVSDTIKACARELGTWHDEPSFRVLAEVMAFDCSEGDDGLQLLDNPDYSPALISRNDSRREGEFETTWQVKPDVIAYWARRAYVAKHPRLRLRYATLAWQFSKAVPGPRNHLLARIAIDAAVGLAEGGHCRFPHQAHAKLRCAQQLALSIRDNERIARVRDAIIAFARQSARDDLPETWGFAFDRLIEQERKVPLSDVLEREIISNLEARLARVATAELGELNPFAAAQAAKGLALRLAKYYRRKNRRDDVRRVLQRLTEAWLRVRGQHDPMFVADGLRETHDLLLQFGQRDDADALEVHLRAVERASLGSLKGVAIPVRISNVKMDEYVNSMTAGDLTDTLIRIARHFIPDPAKVKDDVLDEARDDPFASLIARKSVDHDGRVVARVGSIDEDLDGQVVQGLAHRISVEALALRVVIAAALEKFGVTVDALLEHLYASPAFDESVRPLLGVGITAYLAGEHAVAAHLLIPRIEAAVRRLVELRGGPIRKLARGGDHELRNLDELLRDERLQGCLNEGVTLYLRVLLTDKRGWNLRNDVAHGITPADGFGPKMTDRLFHALLVLSTPSPGNLAAPGDETPTQLNP